MILHDWAPSWYLLVDLHHAPLRVCGDYWLLQAKPEVAGADIGDCFEADAHF